MTRHSLVLPLFLALVGLIAVLATMSYAIDAATDPAVPACNQAVADGYYTVDLYGQCLDDYRDAQEVTP